MEPVEMESPPNQLAVLRALQPGDLLCAVPVYRLLRAAFPAGQISLFGLPWSRSSGSCSTGYIDEWIDFPGNPGFSEQPLDPQLFPDFLHKARALLDVCNDTGISHLAAVLRTPSVVLFSALDPQRWAPANRKLHRPLIGGRPISVEQVLLEADRLLGQEVSHVH